MANELGTSERLAYSVDEICSLVGVSRAFIYALWRQGKGPARLKIGTRTIVTAAALDAWLTAETTP